MQPLIVSAGDPSAVGIELIIDLWLHARGEIAPFFVVGDPYIFKNRYGLCHPKKAKTDIIYRLNEQDLNRSDFSKFIGEIFQEALPILPLSQPQIDKPGEACVENAPLIIESIERCVKYLSENKACALLTAPIAKNVLYESGFAFPGHTEFLSHLAQIYFQKESYPVMMLANKFIRTVPITVHIPLKEVFSKLNSELIIKIATIVHFDLQNIFGIPAPRLFFTGLNPHAGENGSLGAEDKEIIAPAIAFLQQQKINAQGPYPADSLFSQTMRCDYDAVLAMYHDQALIPVKTLDFAHSVNLTLGLPFIRTSPAHGTAFDIAGKNAASSSSMRAAILMAQNLAMAKKSYYDHD